MDQVQKQVQKRENFKIIELAGRKWRIIRFDALTGSYIAYQLMFQMLPTVISAFAGKTAEGEGFLSSLPKTGNVMSREEFTSLQKDCLSVCSEVKVLDGQEVSLPVMLQSGMFAVEGLDNDTMTVLGLTVQALVFNVSGFFDEGPLKDLMSQAAGGQGQVLKQ